MKPIKTARNQRKKEIRDRKKKDNAMAENSFSAMLIAERVTGKKTPDEAVSTVLMMEKNSGIQLTDEGRQRAVAVLTA